MLIFKFFKGNLGPFLSCRNFLSMNSSFLFNSFTNTTKLFLTCWSSLQSFSHNRKHLLAVSASWYSYASSELVYPEENKPYPFQISGMWLSYDVLLNFLFPFRWLRLFSIGKKCSKWMWAGICNSNQSLEMAL